MTTIERIKQEFETLKGQFVITQGHKIERLVAVGQDQHDYYWVTYNGRKFTWNTCVGGLIPLKGYLQDKDYNSFVSSARLNHFDQETCWGDQGKNSQQHKNELMKLSGDDTLLTEVCWDLETVDTETGSLKKVTNLLVDVQSSLLRGVQRKVDQIKDDTKLGTTIREIFNDKSSE